jgi:primosomal protein N' (replication factor Y)
VHRTEGLLRCHYCDAQRALPAVCEACGSETIREFGVGTERVAEEVRRLYPDASVVRMDSDTTTRIGDHARLLDEFGSSGDVLVGTQMVAKGLDFPTVTLVGVIAADIGLHMPDFRAAERTFALITQVCGRSGRARPGEAIVQTYSPEHPAIVHAAAHDYTGFAQGELQQRTELEYPPVRDLVYLGIIGRSRPTALAHAQRYAQMFDDVDGVEVLGPAPYPIARLNNEWRFRIALKAQDGASIRAALRERVLPAARSQRETRVAINVDP